MLQGAGSNVGKSLLVAGLCRAARKRGLSVAPFKPQNMSNNAAVAVDGGEIGRAQAMQATACGLDPIVDMNPVLLKPESEIGAQVVVHGRLQTTVRARDYAALKPSLLEPVLQSYERLRSRFDLVVIEGAGSPAEVNLRSNDIANMGFAIAADVPVVLIGDIDRGGVIAQMVGTKTVLAPNDAAQIQGFIINKFRGDPSLFDNGYRLIAERSGWRGLGVLPYFSEAYKLPAEDAMDLRQSPERGGLRIAGLALSRIANFDDFDPLAQEPGVTFSLIRPGEVLPGDIDLVIIPGSKSTRSDLAFLRAQGWDIDIQAHVRRGGHVLGICGGYQMLGNVVRDPDGIEGPPGDTDGLGLLQIETTMVSEKSVQIVTGRHAATGRKISGYEIHIGRSDGVDRARPFAQVYGKPEGACSADGRICGTYLHGLFVDDDFRTAFLKERDVSASGQSYGATIDTTLDQLAAHMETHLDIDELLKIAR
ncbi:MAG: cobyric acid synthase [Hyphomicrobiaceae bacterium]